MTDYVLVHGAWGGGWAFDRLSADLRAAGHRVVVADLTGLGARKDAFHPGITLATHVDDVVAQIEAAGFDRFVLAGHKELPLPAPVRRFVVNDVGPTIEAAAIQRIAAYVGQGGRYDSLQQAADALWAISTSFGPHTPEQWLELTRPMVVPASQRSADGTAKVDAPDGTDGPWMLHYDPALAIGLRAITPEAAAQGGAIMWGLYDAITARVLVTRGAQSDLLSRETATAMTQRGPRATLVEFEGVGHAPTFVDPAQAAVVADFLFD